MYFDILNNIFDVAYMTINNSFQVSKMSQSERYTCFELIEMIVDELTDRNYSIFSKPMFDQLASVDDIITDHDFIELPIKISVK